MALVTLYSVILRIIVGLIAHDLIIGRTEITTPVNSWKRLAECLALKNADIDPYESDSCHSLPLIIWLFSSLMEYLPRFTTILLFPLIDVFTAYILAWSSTEMLRNMVKRQNNSLKDYADAGIEKLLIRAEDIPRLSRIVKLCYLFNPYSILSCAGRSSNVLNNLSLALTLLFMAKDRPNISLIFLAVASYLDIYPLVLVASVFLCSVRKDDTMIYYWFRLFRQVSFFASVWIALIGISYALDASWEFIHNTYGFMVSVPDLTPNVGLFWYFFTETFDHFRLFFLWIFVLNPFIYVIPLAIRLEDEPILLCHLLLMIVSIFKSYPSVGDSAFYLSLLPIWSHLFRYFRHGLIVACCLIACSVLAPVMWHMWIETGSANSNFYFAITLLYSAAQIFLLTDILYAFLRRNVHLVHGVKPMLDGEEATVILE